MYWRVASFQHASPLESLLDKEVVTVEELLDEDDLIQETRALNPKVISFLSQASNLEVMIRALRLPNPELSQKLHLRQAGFVKAPDLDLTAKHDNSQQRYIMQNVWKCRI